MKTLFGKLNLAVAMMLAVGAVHAQSGNAVYFGAGSAKNSDQYSSNKTPMSIGFLTSSNFHSSVIGFDISAEGTKLDSTGGRYNEISQGTSFNVLMGSNFVQDGAFRVDGTVLLGARESSESCPKSYLGYQCYADSEPKSTYKVNYGVLLALSYKSVMLGVRATGESTQALIGIRF